MSDVSLIGLGAMGSALAKALIEAGHQITVWNRTREKTARVVALGAVGATDVKEAVLASNLIMVCVNNYTATRNLLGTKEVIPHLEGRTLVQLGTGTPNEARENETWMRAHKGEYLDVTIQPYPEGIGDADSRFLISGSETAFEVCEPFLKHFGGDLRYLGENVGAANALDLGELIYCLSMYVGFAHAARICESEEVGLDLFASLFQERDPARDLADMVHADNYTLGAIHPGASVNVWEGCLQLIQEHARAKDLNCEVPDFVSSLFRRGIDSGYGEEDVAALVKVLRTDRA
jgi:3-hydroxyisobutyrate dehydrogenase-like beta-hydroxyacid dehydrogenase